MTGDKNELSDFSDYLLDLVAVAHGLDLAIRGSALPDDRDRDGLLRLSQTLRADIDVALDTFDLLSRRLRIVEEPATA